MQAVTYYEEQAHLALSRGPWQGDPELLLARPAAEIAYAG